MRVNVAVGAVVIAFAAFFAAGLRFVDDTAGYAGLSPRFLPTLVAVALAILGVLIALRPDSVLAQAEEASADADHPGPNLLGLAWVFAGLVLDLAVIGWIGFPLASAVLMVCVARGYGSRRPLRDALIALAITLPIWALFAKGLQISLPLFPLAGI